ncbi:hypothetical protein TH5_21465 [Thalassospira xianhensis MCCC 1A02616]|uniref:Uncharacterized protein n=1 Tax=Thalassospira xianhensis MCCC 1A02616 TaxID=1177929 RepID=A0A367U771_9PROT|nr:hypothetical protein TH5_21465 [Thalassospira xianhensis MCCC 1A02616]
MAALIGAGLGKLTFERRNTVWKHPCISVAYIKGGGWEFRVRQNVHTASGSSTLHSLMTVARGLDGVKVTTGIPDAEKLEPFLLNAI